MSVAADETVREVTLAGNRVVVLRCFPGEGGMLVEAEIVPVGGGAPVRSGPFAFPTVADAHRFVDEALLALLYLGCQVER